MLQLILTSHVLQRRSPMRDSAITSIEQLLVNRCLAGDKAAWHQIATVHERPLVCILRSLAHRFHWPPELAEEAAQQTWQLLLERRWRPLAAYRAHDATLLAFLTRLALDQRRLIQREQQRRSWEVLRPFQGHEPILAMPFEIPTDLEIEDLCSTLTDRRTVFLKMRLLRPDPRHMGRRSEAFRQTKHHVWVRARAYVLGD
jgi:hypothetical protein